MNVDPWTKACLTVIALALLVIALRPIVPVAHAQEGPMKCEITGGTLDIGKFDDELRVKVEAAFGSPGSSRSQPHYVKIED